MSRGVLAELRQHLKTITHMASNMEPGDVLATTIYQTASEALALLEPAPPPDTADLIARLQRFVGRTNTPQLHLEIADEARRWLDGKPAGAS